MLVREKKGLGMSKERYQSTFCYSFQELVW